MGQTINPFGKDIIKVETTVCGRSLSLEVGRVGFRSSATVLARFGDTVVLANAMVSPSTAAGFDYFPLSIDYEEKMYAAGKISGSRFIKREGRPSDEAVLIGRLIDRPIRPLWPKGYRHQVQGVVTVLSMDPTFRPDSIAMIAMSTAFMLTGAPFGGPVAGLRVGLIDGEFKAFAHNKELAEAKLDIVVAGTKDAIMMVEAGANEATEEEVTKALEFAHKAMQPAIDLQLELAKKLEVKPRKYALNLPAEDIVKKVEKWLDGKLGDKLRTNYPDRHLMISEIKDLLLADFEEKLGTEKFEESKNDIGDAFTAVVNKDVRDGILKKGVRPDGRKLDEIRPLSIETGILPRAHGSALFTRGMTQALNIVTLAPLSYVQIVDTMEKEGERRYLHHYNAPGYTIGEIKRLGGPGRREIGHGTLAERALLPMIPDEADFPYTIRSVTEIMSQHGSTSMAATCSSCLALMDAGVPLKKPVSGIAMGLMTEGDKAVVLSDIADAEDFAGDMDFKITGTKDGITALQMDMKVHGLPIKMLTKTLQKAKEGKTFILKAMLDVLPNYRKEMSPYAPRVEAIKINPDKIRDVIGKGGETINKIIAETGADIDIKDDGIILVSSPDKKSIDATIKWIEELTESPEIGKTYKGKVVKIMDFGVFVNILPGVDGMVHVSEMADKRTNHPRDVAKEGDEIKVKIVAIDDRDRIVLSMKQAK